VIAGVADRLSIEFELVLRVKTTPQSLQLSSGCIGAILRPRIKGNLGAWRSPMNGIHESLEQCQARGRQTDSSADHYSVIAVGS
jgi:hypothetical protein